VTIWKAKVKVSELLFISVAALSVDVSSPRDVQITIAAVPHTRIARQRVHLLATLHRTMLLGITTENIPFVSHRVRGPHLLVVVLMCRGHNNLREVLNCVRCGFVLVDSLSLAEA
jgi:uncharacterized paraquat-inducible protein A